MGTIIATPPCDDGQYNNEYKMSDTNKNVERSLSHEARHSIVGHTVISDENKLSSYSSIREEENTSSFLRAKAF